MHAMKRRFVILIFIGLSMLGFCAIKAMYAKDVGNPTVNSSEKTFQELQDELNKDKHKKKIISRFEVVEGARGINIEDISLTLLDYSYHRLNDSSRKQPFVIVRCRINISKFEKEADKLREHLKSTARQAPVEIQLPDLERTIVGLLDDVKDEFITFASLPNSVKPAVKFADLRKNKPEHIILTMEPSENCTECDQNYALNTAVMGFDVNSKTYSMLMELKTYRFVDSEDDLDAGTGYIDRSNVSWSDWINNEYRELIVTTEREIIETEAGAKPRFRNKKEIYSWLNDKELALVERIIDGKRTMSRRGGILSAGSGVTLKDGELCDMNGSKITSTDGKIDGYLLSPDKRYVAYSIIVGQRNDVGLYEDSEDIPQVPVHNVVVMDIEQKKQLREIKPPSEIDPFIYAKRWISNEELLLYDADGIAVSRYYFYDAGINELRRGNLGDLQE